MSALLRKVISRQLSAFSLFLFILFIANLFIFTPSALAVNTTELNSNNFNSTINTGAFHDDQLRSVYSMFYGMDPYGGLNYSHQVMAYVNEQGQLTMKDTPVLSTGDASNGMLAKLGTTVATLYTPPTSSAEYLANLGENIGIAPKPALAQEFGGSGNNVIKPILKLWTVTRNIAYMGFILVFMAAGMMIMFRQKLNPQTVIGIQQALPGIVVGLILVTFSYFIAALLVDMSFVGTKIVVEVFKSANMDNLYGDTGSELDTTYNKSDAFYMFGKAGGGNFLSNVGGIFGDTWGTIGPDLTHQQAASSSDYLATIIGGIFGPLGLIVGCLFGAGTTCQSFQAGGALVVSTLASILVPIILAIALMIQFIRLIIALLLSYIQILIYVVGGPIFIMISAIPGRGGLLSYWFKGILANALVFPAVFAGFLFAGMLLKYNFTAGGQMPLFGGIGTDIVKSLLAFAVLLALPSIPDMVKDAMGVKSPQAFTKAAMGGFMGGVGVGRQGVGTGYQQAMQHSGLAAERRGIEEAKIAHAKESFAPMAEGRAEEMRPTGLWGWIRRGARDLGPRTG